MRTLDALWNKDDPTAAPNQTQAASTPIPPLAEQYLAHAIAAGTPVASAVRLQMTGEIKLKKWLPFTATQVVRIHDGFVWTARVKQGLVFITGFDQFIRNVGEMRWKLMGLFPVMAGTGPDISRSAGDRFAMERIFLPSAFLEPDVEWTPNGSLVSVAAPGIAPMSLGIEPTGRVTSVEMMRWGKPTGDHFALRKFGGFVDEESTWAGYTIPSRLRIGWHFGTDEFEEGEFFRASITHAEFH